MLHNNVFIHIIIVIILIDISSNIYVNSIERSHSQHSVETMALVD